MDRERGRVLGLALVALGLLVAALVVMPWWRMSFVGMTAEIDLRHVSACQLGVCMSAPLDRMGGSLFTSCCHVVFFGGIVVAALVAYSVGGRLIAGYANERVTAAGYWLAVIVFLAVMPGLFLFGPDPGHQDVDTGALLGSIEITVTRSAAPFAMLAGCAMAFAALYFAQKQPDVAGTALPVARVVAAPAPVVEAKTSVPIPVGMTGKVKFAVSTAELTRGGIDARREDGSTQLVMWRDVVGVVVRKLPTTLEGATFVDIVSTAGATLRILPWSRLTGETLPSTDEAARARAVVKLVRERCPGAKIDPASGHFVEDNAAAAQLPDEATLATHDARLA